jgi:hypothetical protein
MPGLYSRRTGSTGAPRPRRHPLSYANVVATLALFLALGGTAWAANQISPGVRKALKGDAGPAGATGATGPQGVQGNQGSAGSQGNAGNNGSLNPNGYRIFVAGTLTLQNGATIERNGNSAAGSTPGAALPAGSLGAGQVGENPEDGESAVPNSLGGSGGCGFTGSLCNSPGGVTSAPAVANGGAGVFRSAMQALTGYPTGSTTLIAGGGGGGGGESGVASGGGAGVVIVAARTVSLTSGSAVISANGGTGGTTAGGGGGGVVVVVSTSAEPSGLTITASGGTASGGAVSGSAGFTDWLS